MLIGLCSAVRTGKLGVSELMLVMMIIEVRGVAMLSTQLILFQFIVPTLLPLVDLLLVPYFLARCAGWWYAYRAASGCAVCEINASYATCHALVRYSFHTYLLLRLVIWLGVSAMGYMRKAYAEWKARWELNTGAQLVNRE